MKKLKGIPIHHGIVEGEAFVKADLIKAISSQDHCPVAEKEVKTYLSTLDLLKKELSNISSKKSQAHYATAKKMAALYIAILNDPVFTKEIPKIITLNNFSAAHAVSEQLKLIELEFSQLDNEYFGTRFDDFRSIGEKIIERLLGIRGFSEIKRPKIIVAHSLSAAELLHIPSQYILGLIVATGGSTSHAAILAEAMGIPSVFGVEESISHIGPYDEIIVDGYNGEVILQPTKEISQQYQDLKLKRIHYETTIYQDADSSNCTTDGTPFTVMANIGNMSEAPLISKYHADGIGLLRTETIVLMKDKLLSADTQAKFYSQLFKYSNDLPVTIRTLDLGGDKVIKNNKFLNNDLNYFFGFRSTRQFVDDPSEFKKQIQVLLDAYEMNPNIRIMIPFITTLQEFIILKKVIIDLYLARNPQQKICPIPIGMMVEIPATAICIEDFMPHTDFISIGTNDLTQYVLASERNNSYVSDYLNSSHPAIFRLIKLVADTCNKYSVPVSLCGEMAKSPHLTRVFLGLGITNLSLTPIHIPMVKYIASHSDIAECQKVAHHIFQFQYSEEIVDYLKKELNSFLKKQNAHFDDYFIVEKEPNRLFTEHS